MIHTQAGGMDIEEVAHKTPEKIFTQPIDIKQGITDAQVNIMQLWGLSHHTTSHMLEPDEKWTRYPHEPGDVIYERRNVTMVCCMTASVCV